MSILLRGITSNHNGDFYCLNCFHSYSTKNGLKKHERVCNDHDDCHEEMPNEDEKILECNLECLLEKTHFCQHNPKKSYTEKKHTPSGYSWFTCCLFDASKNKFG